MSFKYDVRVQCQGKFPHSTYSAAESTFGHKHNHGMTAYKCVFCGFWHIAHIDKTLKLRRSNVKR